MQEKKIQTFQNGNSFLMKLNEQFTFEFALK